MGVVCAISGSVAFVDLAVLAHFRHATCALLLHGLLPDRHQNFCEGSLLPGLRDGQAVVILLDRRVELGDALSQEVDLAFLFGCRGHA